MPDTLRALIRTVVPAVVGWLLARPVVGELGLDESALSAVATAVTTAGYYAMVRLLELVHPGAGILLGAPGAPTYGAPGADVE